jgi:hypothetical protein
MVAVVQDNEPPLALQALVVDVYPIGNVTLLLQTPPTSQVATQAAKQCKHTSLKP